MSNGVASHPFNASPSDTHIPDDLSILPLDSTSTQGQNLSIFPLDTTTSIQGQNLSIFPLDTTTMQNGNLSNLPLDTTNFSTLTQAGDVSHYQALVSSMAPDSVQTSLAKFHDIVCTLVRNYATMTAQVQ